MTPLTRITIDPDLMGGEPCIRGMRITVGTIIGLVASGRSLPEILAAYPYLEEEDVRESLSYIGLDRRFDEIKSGLVKPISGEEVFERPASKERGTSRRSRIDIRTFREAGQDVAPASYESFART